MQTISTAELKSKLNSKETLVLVDVREPEENAVYNIGGILLPLGNILSMQVEPIEEYKDQTVVCYCRSGQRSMQACLMLETMGFSDVRNLTGGMLEWEANNK